MQGDIKLAIIWSIADFQFGREGLKRWYIGYSKVRYLWV